MEAVARKIYTLDEDLAPIIKGQIELQNVEDVDPIGFLNNLAACGHSMRPQWGWTKIDGRLVWTQYFLTHAGMGANLDGGGYAVIYRSYPEKTARVVKFAICKHEIQAGAGADPRRGWHPGSCKHCGLDMTVDSGD
ncbi:hypothetical protein SJ05684_c30270 [Sinorhizobium sojae CCBAU 05684]|uniref:Uncharacterized protein n=1 Tax=Sinorhizobium sojae CCBAU 05684 TaxID=716928 RepID=A0A249PEU5_9HYPH|nr:hypothetical protein [Sinorhizobium sojae]ASY64451.1 hypothetical protein SJ05684_c30270 [Sinorhizobium sojae CCBAU 05684]